MKPIPMRRALPLIFVTLTLGLILLGHWQWQAKVVESRSPQVVEESLASESAKTVYWRLGGLIGYHPPTEPLWMAINLPAMLVAVPVILAIERTEVQVGSLIERLLSLPFVALFWYGFGYALDRRRGLLLYDLHRPRRTADTALFGVGFTVSLLGVLFFSALLIYRWEVPPLPVLVLPLWLLAFAYYFFLQLKRRPFRRDVRTGPS